MKALFPPLADPASLPKRVFCVAPHADDEVFGCGGLLALHAERGDEIRVVVLTDGAAGDPNHTEADIQSARQAESRRAGEALGVRDHRFLGLPDGGLAQLEASGELKRQIERELEEFGPALVYGPSPQEMHPDHRATSRALIEALAAGENRRVFLYGVNTHVTAGILFDTTAVFDKKRAAINAFESQLRYHDLQTKADAVDRARTVNIEDPNVHHVEGFADLQSGDLLEYQARMAGVLDSLFEAGHGLASSSTAAQVHPLNTEQPSPSEKLSPEEKPNPGAQVSRVAPELPAATAVISTWNKSDEVRDNLLSLRKQTLPFESIVVVDNASTDETQAMIAREFPEVRLICMPNSAYGACETFNIGFASVQTPLTAILDDDVELPPDWLEKTTRRIVREPDTTAVVSTKVVEPGMPDSYLHSESLNSERYMSTFRGCGSLARSAALAEAGYYDERLFIYGNERDLTCRLLNLGYRVLQYPEAETFHRQPFGIQMGKRSLYYHARNAWLGMLKYAPLSDLARMPFLVLFKVILRGKETEAKGQVTDATGTIGIGSSIRNTPGSVGILFKAALSVLANVPYCLKHRKPVRSEDFDLPLQ